MGSRNRNRRPRPSPAPAGGSPDRPLLVTWQGEQFRIADKVGVMPLLTFAHLAEQGIESFEMEALAAMHDVLEQCLHPGDWPRFKTHATQIRANDEDLLQLVQLTMEALSGRPTQQPANSSPGPRSMTPSSEDDSSSRVIARLTGRPDLQVQVWQAQQNQRALRAV